MGAFDCIVCGSQSATHDAGNCDQHDVLANVALGPHHRRAQGVAGQIDEGPSRQDNVTTREGGCHTGSPSAAEYMSSLFSFQKSKHPDSPWAQRLACANRAAHPMVFR
jgi:hypothetical protein